jgi:hypothetical protein
MMRVVTGLPFCTAALIAACSSPSTLATNPQPQIETANTATSSSVSAINSHAYVSPSTTAASSSAPAADLQPNVETANAVASSSGPATNSQLPTLPLQIAKQANAFIDSIGMNVHLSYTNTIYVTQYSVFRNLLISSGVRHIRDGLIDTTWQPYYEHLTDLASQGIKATLITSIGESTALLQQYPQRVPSVIEAYEAPNEMDQSGDANWASDTRSFQQILYSAVTSGALTSSFPVIGPSLTEGNSYPELGNLSAEMDYGNMHDYFAGFNPGTDGWGGPGFGSSYGSILYNLGQEAEVAGAKPVIATETGYCTTPGVTGAVSMAVQATYEPRLFLEQWNAGVIRTFQYAFIDDGTGCEGTLGIIDGSMNPKPAYYSLKNLIALLNDPGANFTPQSVHFSLTGATSNVNQTLLEKQDGTYELALWVELPSWNVNIGTGVPVVVPPQKVSVTLWQPPSTMSITAFSSTGSVQTQSLTPSATIPLTLTDNVIVLTFKF